jgi:hypothetical protein
MRFMGGLMWTGGSAKGSFQPLIVLTGFQRRKPSVEIQLKQLPLKVTGSVICLWQNGKDAFWHLFFDIME